LRVAKIHFFFDLNHLLKKDDGLLVLQLFPIEDTFGIVGHRQAATNVNIFAHRAKFVSVQCP